MPTPIYSDYLVDVTCEMRLKSEAIRRDFATHRPSAGDNREDLVEVFLKDHLPKKFGVSTGLVISSEGMFSNQADLVIVDDQNNAPLYPNSTNKLWPVETVLALIEVKTSLSPSEITDAVAKARRFKSLQRNFCEAGQDQRITESLFVLWGFEAPSVEIFKSNLTKALEGVPVSEQPDLIIVPGRFVACSGEYRELSKLGQPNSQYRARMIEEYGADLSSLTQGSNTVYECDENALHAGYLWLDSWLRQAGSRLVDPLLYRSKDLMWHRVL